MSDMYNRYELMNKDTKLADLIVSDKVATIGKIYEDIPKFIENINSWIMSRTLLINRENLLTMAKLAGINDEFTYLSMSKAISITDTLWVNDKKAPITWDKINPYKNRLSRIMAEIALNGIEDYNGENLQSPSPQYRIDGSIDKCVKRENGKLLLYKTSGEQWSMTAGIRPYSEYYVSKLERKLGFRYFTDYNIKVSKTNNGYNKPYSVCEIFTDEKFGLVQLANTNLKDMSINELIQYFEYKNDQRSLLILAQMLFIDSLCLNIDRHSGNWGFLYDNDNFDIVGLAPIYDNDCALGSTIVIQSKSLDEAYKEVYNKQPKMGFGDYNEQFELSLTHNVIYKLALDLVSNYNSSNFRIANRFESLHPDRYKFMHYIIYRQIENLKKIIRS